MLTLDLLIVALSYLSKEDKKKMNDDEIESQMA